MTERHRTLTAFVQRSSLQRSRSPDVLVVGETIVDVIIRHGARHAAAGGSPANVAIGISQLGIATAFQTSIGSDGNGELLRSHLSAAGVDVVASSYHAGDTATAIATLDDSGDASYEFAIGWDFPLEPIPRAVAVVHTGSIAAFMEPGAGKVRALLQEARSRATLTFDPNIRPRLLHDHARAIDLFETTVALVDVVKLSEDDAAWLYPGVDRDTILERILAAGPRLAVLTRGSAGSELRSRGARANIPARPVTVVDTVGAGDSYMAALIFGLLELGTNIDAEDDLFQLGTLAASAAAFTVARRGAVMPRRTDLI